MAIPEDIVDLWSGFPVQLKVEPLDDLFDSDPIAAHKKKVYEASLRDDNATDSLDGVVTDSLEKVKTPKKPQELEGVTALGVLGSDNTVVSGIQKPSKLYAYEDFHSFLAREGGLNPDRLSILVDDSPSPDEDFVSFLARSNGIKDEQMINRLRQALKLEPVLEFKNGVIPDRPVKVEVGMDLKVLEGEDAASFFVRAGSWESASSISEELASVGLDDYADEDAESFFRRTENTGDNDLEGLEDYLNGSRPEVTSVSLISTPKQELDVLSPKEQTSVHVIGSPESGGSIPANNDGSPELNDSIPADGHVIKKRKSSDE